jgi:sphingolipid delta-4 desaturase
MQTENFHQAQFDQPHPQRTRDIMKAHPEVRQLIGRNPWTAAIMAFILILQISLAYVMGRVLGPHYWWVAPIVAFCIGAFCNHTMYVIIHEATHNLIFTSKIANRWVAMGADLPNLVPGSMGFVVFHLKHHSHQGDHDQDADMANDWEARLIGNSSIGKALWLLFFPVFQVTRPARLKHINMWSKWTWINLACAITFDTAIVLLCGWVGLLYLVFSFFFSIGLHPVGGRWIQEHYTPDIEQETFSYYGPINIIALNVGYHNEHHDFPAIPWNNLPKLKALAPEYYDHLKYHTSWTKIWLTFIFDKRYSLYSRVERIGEGKVRPLSGPARKGERNTTQAA